MAPHLIFRRLSIEQGLSQNSVNCILQDRTGFMWFGTETGLNRFDGYTFKIFLPREGDANSLSNSWINALYEDEHGSIWVGTENGLNRYLPSRERFVRYFHDPANPSSLSSNRIFCIYEDHSGRLWIGTDAGLNQLDRSHNRFIHYRHNPADPNSLSNDVIRTIMEDPYGRLWVGTSGGGLDCLDPTTGRFLHFRANQPSPPPSPPPSRPKLPSSSGSHPSSTSSPAPGQTSTSSTSSTFSPPNSFTVLPDDYITALAITPAVKAEPDTSNMPASSGNAPARAVTDKFYLWVGTNNGGLVRLDLSTVVFPAEENASFPTLPVPSVKIYRHDPASPNSLSHNAVVSLAYEPLPGEKPFSLFIKSAASVSPRLWIGTYNGGLNCLDLATDSISVFRNRPSDPFSLSDNRVVSLYHSPDGILWVGTYGGVNQLNLNQRKFLRFISDITDPASLSYPEVRAILYSRSRVLWVGTDGGGLNGFDRLHARRFLFQHDPTNPRSPRHLSSNRVFSIAEDPATGRLWVGTYDGGLNLVDPSTGLVRHFRHKDADPHSLSDDRVRPLLLDSRGRLWVGTDGGGLNLFDPAGQKVLKVYRYDPSDQNTISSDRIFSIAEDRQGFIWVAAYGGGLCRLDPTTDRITRYSKKAGDPTSLSSNYIIHVCAASDGSIWAGTNGGGLCRLDPRTGISTSFTESQGLLSSVVYAVLEDDDGRIWFSSNHGLSRLDPKTGRFKNFDINDGLQSYEFNGGACHKGWQGMLYFGGINGFNAFNPREIVDNTTPPRVVLTELQVSNIPVRPGEPLSDGSGKVLLSRSLLETRALELGWPHRKILLEFAALDYTCPEKNQYAYLLEGFESEWNYVGNRRFASYSNLPPGRYTFRVKASNNDGYWNEQGVSLSIRVVPPFWLRWWFRGLMALAAVGVIYLGFRYRLGQARRRAEQLERVVADRTEELRLANEKLRQLSITDELTGVANYRRFHDFLNYEWRRAARNGAPISLLIADLDNFKQLNDTLGHQAGDECLRCAAQAMVSACRRPSDLVSRYGGDEFAVVLAETDLAGAYIVAEKIRTKIEQLVVGGKCMAGEKAEQRESQVQAENQNEAGTEARGEQGTDEANIAYRRITVCIGCASARPAEGGTPDDLIALADRALYRAKSSGKNLTAI